ncbi:MAG: hypothetical protein KBG15_11905, partial [Kofleriaceae bacterium]|nr:hypothetical protein [Kofleriaceae bacterium]
PQPRTARANENTTVLTLPELALAVRDRAATPISAVRKSCVYRKSSTRDDGRSIASPPVRQSASPPVRQSEV